MATPPVLLWLRQDLRLADQPALNDAAQRGPVIPIYILEENIQDPWPMGAASKWWLHYALEALAEDLKKRDLHLLLRRGEPGKILYDLARETGAKTVVWNRRYEPAGHARDNQIEKNLLNHTIEVSIHNGSVLFLPDLIRSKTDGSYKVYTPFARACLAHDPGKALHVPRTMKGVSNLKSETLKSWSLLPTKPNWAKAFETQWGAGEAAGQKAIEAFVRKNLATYQVSRNRPDQEGTSRLSPHLHFGHISPRQVWHAMQLSMQMHPQSSAHAETFLKEILWREFAYHTLSRHPEMPSAPLNEVFAKFPTVKSAPALMAWQQGQTGYPIVDAGMRQLWQTGWMHNRVRMIVGSFLVKHLLQKWQDGALWFWDTLVDADLASNSMNWQWVAGCGIDAAPYYRIFNPILQGQKFDPNGDYVRQFVPELKKMPAAFIHEPWAAPEDVLLKAGIELGKTYPKPLIEHGAARARALNALKTLHGREPTPSKQSKVKASPRFNFEDEDR